jgi:hypothetical protein
MLCVETLRHVSTNKRNIGETSEKHGRQEGVKSEEWGVKN